MSDHVRATIGSCMCAVDHSTLWECCELMDWTANRFKPYITQSLCPNCCMRHPPGMDSPARKTVRKSSTSAFSPPTQTSFASLCGKLDDKMFEKVSMDEHHVLHCLLPPVNVTGHNLRRRTHSFVLPAKCKTVLQDKNFFKRVLYKNSY